VIDSAIVFKQTVYKHFADKQSLFTEIVIGTVNEVSPNPRSDKAGAAVREVPVEIGRVGSEYVADPRFALVRDDAQVPVARDRVGDGGCAKAGRVVARGKEDVVVQLVLLLPHSTKTELPPRPSWIPRNPTS
jgi:hypothetical protein